jgi:hypothetical protein
MIREKQGAAGADANPFPCVNANQLSILSHAARRAVICGGFLVQKTTGRRLSLGLQVDKDTSWGTKPAVNALSAIKTYCPHNFMEHLTTQFQPTAGFSSVSNDKMPYINFHDSSTIIYN